MKAVGKYILMAVIWQIFTIASMGQSKARPIHNDEDGEVEYNEGEMAIRYWENLENQIQEKNKANGMKGLDRRVARLNAFRSMQTTNAPQAVASISGAWSQVSQSPSNVGMGRIEDIAFDASNTNIFYVATSGGGVWKTVDGGTSYFPRTDGLPTGGVSSIVIDPNNNNILYIYAGGGLGSNNYPGTIYKSTDASFTWVQTGYYNMPEVGYELKIHPSNSNILFLATNLGLYKSIDAGVSWNIVLVATENTAIYDVEFKPGDPTVMYAVGQHKVYISEANGDNGTWVSSTMPTAPTTVNSYAASRLAVSAASPNDLFVANGVYSPTNANGTVFYVKGTYNSGSNTVAWNASIKVTACGRLCYRSGGGRIYGDIYVNQANSSNVMMGGVDNFTTSNGGSTWVLKSKDCNNGLSKNIHDDVGKIRVNNGKFFVATDGGLHSQTENYTSTSAAWTNLSGGMEITQLYDHDASPQDAERYIYANQDNGCQVRTSAIDYNNYLGGDGTACKIYKGNKELYYGCIQSGEFLTRHNTDLSTNYITPNQANLTNSYDPADTGKYSGTFNFSKAFEMSQNNSTDLYAVKKSFYVSSDRGDSWVRFGITGATNTHYILRVGKSNSNRVYVVEDVTNLFQRSDDGGVSWTNITANKPWNGVISDIAISATNSLDIYLTYYGNQFDAKVYHSTNGGVSWTNLSYGLPNVDTRCITLVGNAENAIYIGNDFGVYYMDNNLGHWINYSNGLPVVFAMNIVYDPINVKLSVATYGRGIWTSDAYSAAACVTDRSLNSTYYYRNVYAASNDITSVGTVYGDANSTIKFSAGHQIILQPGFAAQKNSDFTSSLEGCDPAPGSFLAVHADTVSVAASKIEARYKHKIRVGNKGNIPVVDYRVQKGRSEGNPTKEMLEAAKPVLSNKPEQ
ncbi:MAG: 3-coathanger stack domain-containing protein [Chitinophagaceae bacterium]